MFSIGFISEYKGRYEISTYPYLYNYVTSGRHVFQGFAPVPGTSNINSSINTKELPLSGIGPFSTTVERLLNYQQIVQCTNVTTV